MDNVTRKKAMRNSILKVKPQLNDMKQQLGLTSLASPKHDALYVIESLSDTQPEVTPYDILSHELADTISQPLGWQFIFTLVSNMKKGN